MMQSGPGFPPLVPSPKQHPEEGGSWRRVAGELERSLHFLQRQHGETLAKLHEEVERLKRENKELHYKLIMHPVLQKIPDPAPSGKTSSQRGGSASKSPHGSNIGGEHGADDFPLLGKPPHPRSRSGSKASRRSKPSAEDLSEGGIKADGRETPKEENGGSLKEDGGSIKENGGSRKENGGIRREDGGSIKENGGSRKENGGFQKEDRGIRKENGGIPKENGFRKEDGGTRKENGGIPKEDRGIRKENGGTKKEDGGIRKEDGGLRKENVGPKKEDGVPRKVSLAVTPDFRDQTASSPLPSPPPSSSSAAAAENRGASSGSPGSPPSLSSSGRIPAASSNPFLASVLPSRLRKPPTLEECEAVIRQLWNINHMQMQELMYLRTCLEDIHRTRRIPEDYLLSAGRFGNSQSTRLPRMRNAAAPKQWTLTPLPAAERAVLPALKQTLGNAFAERQKRTQAVQRKRLHRTAF